MKATGPKEERETIIRFDEEDEQAIIWTASMPVYRKLLKSGWFPFEDEERHAVFEVPKKRIRLPKPFNKGRSETMKARRKATNESQEV